MFSAAEVKSVLYFIQDRFAQDEYTLERLQLKSVIECDLDYKGGDLAHMPRMGRLDLFIEKVFPFEIERKILRAKRWYNPRAYHLMQRERNKRLSQPEVALRDLLSIIPHAQLEAILAEYGYVPQEAQDGAEPSTYQEEAPVEQAKRHIDEVVQSLGLTPEQREDLFMDFAEQARLETSEVKETDSVLAELIREQEESETLRPKPTKYQQMLEVFKRRHRRQHTDLVGADELTSIYRRQTLSSRLSELESKLRAKGKCIEHVPAYRIVPLERCDEET